MKKQLLIITALVLSIAFSSCKKDDKDSPAPTPAPTPPTLFVDFNLDGVATHISRTDYHLNTGSSSYTASAFFDLTTFVNISLNIPQDSILGTDLQALIGQQIPIGSCGGCPTNMNLQYDINGDDYESFDNHNPFPANYFKLTSVTFYKTYTVFNESHNLYYVTGEFDVKLSYGTTIKNATNGKFRMIFQDYTD